jgi:hypothetical protein
VLLLTEVRADTAVDGLLIHHSSEMVDGRSWAAVASPRELRPLEAPHPGSAAAEVDGWLRVCSSVLPWNGCGPWWPWHTGSTAEKTADAIVGIEGSSPRVWGGDWNHSLVGGETAGSLPGRKAPIHSTASAFELRLRTYRTGSRGCGRSTTSPYPPPGRSRLPLGSTQQDSPTTTPTWSRRRRSGTGRRHRLAT